MIEDFNLVARKTAEQLRALLAQTERPEEQRPSRGGMRGRMPVIVRCTSATAVGGGSIGLQSYPAITIAAHATDTTQPELTPVWLTVLGSGGTPVEPVADNLYYGMFAGDFDPGSDNRPRVFAVDRAGLTNTSRAMTGSYNLVTQDTWENVNDGADVSVSLTAGTWLLFAPVTGRLQANPIADGMWLVARLYNSTDSVVVPGTGISVSDGLTIPASAANILLLTGTIVSRPYTITSTKTVKLQAAFNDPGGTTATVYGEISDFVDLGNTTHITALRIG